MTEQSIVNAIPELIALAEENRMLSERIQRLVDWHVRAEKAENDAEKWKEVAQMLAEELNEANSERFPVSWEDASESSPAYIAYINLRDKEV